MMHVTEIEEQMKTKLSCRSSCCCCCCCCC